MKINIKCLNINSMEIQKQERANISFISHSGKSLVNECVAEYNFLLWKLKSLLASKGEDSIEQAIRYQANPTYKRDEVIRECEEYIKKNENATISSGCDYAKGFRLVRQRIY
jgi:hypothetical protein